MDNRAQSGYIRAVYIVYGLSKMREVATFRSDSAAAQALRSQAANEGKTVTGFLEGLVMGHIGKPDPRPLLVEVLRLLRSSKPELQEIGVRHAEIFGSVARGEHGPDSDVDILVDLDPEIVSDLFAYSRVQRTLQEIVGRPVDIVMRGENNKPGLTAEIARDGVHAY
jgi:uncharacterized protein